MPAQDDNESFPLYDLLWSKPNIQHWCSCVSSLADNIENSICVHVLALSLTECLVRGGVATAVQHANLSAVVIAHLHTQSLRRDRKQFSLQPWSLNLQHERLEALSKAATLVPTRHN
eukprot:5780680-Amphidinium_carterae.1